MARAWLGLLILGALGCIPIPVNEDTLAIPAGEIVVTTAQGDPIEGALVLVSRHELYPHYVDDPQETWEDTTDAEGLVRFEHSPRVKRQLPLMMHGVSTDTWYICAQVEGYQTRRVQWLTESDSLEGVSWEELLEGADAPRRTIALDEGEATPCDELFGEYEFPRETTAASSADMSSAPSPDSD